MTLEAIALNSLFNRHFFIFALILHIAVETQIHVELFYIVTWLSACYCLCFSLVRCLSCNIKSIGSFKYSVYRFPKPVTVRLFADI